MDLFLNELAPHLDQWDYHYLCLTCKLLLKMTIKKHVCDLSWELIEKACFDGQLDMLTGYWLEEVKDTLKSLDAATLFVAAIAGGQMGVFDWLISLKCINPSHFDIESLLLNSAYHNRRDFFTRTESEFPELRRVDISIVDDMLRKYLTSPIPAGWGLSQGTIYRKFPNAEHFLESLQGRPSLETYFLRKSDLYMFKREYQKGSFVVNYLDLLLFLRFEKWRLVKLCCELIPLQPITSELLESFSEVNRYNRTISHYRKHGNGTSYRTVENAHKLLARFLTTIKVPWLLCWCLDRGILDMDSMDSDRSLNGGSIATCSGLFWRLVTPHSSILSSKKAT